MIAADVLKKIKELEIHTKRVLAGGLVGENQSAVKGSGFNFDQIRDYQVGDDIRFIDWKSSSRANKVLVKQYIEERNKDVIIALDISASSNFSSHNQLRRDIMAEIASVLALVAAYGKDRIGVMLFSDKVELYVPLGRGVVHARYIIERIYSHVAQGTKTSVVSVCQRLASLACRNATVFLISDFIDDNFEKALGYAVKKHDLIAVRCLDGNEYSLPLVGFLAVEDSENAQQGLLNTNIRGHGALQQALRDRIHKQEMSIKKTGADLIDIDIGRPFITDIILFFKRRMLY